MGPSPKRLASLEKEELGHRHSHAQKEDDRDMQQKMATGLGCGHLQAQEPRIAPSARSWNRQGGALRQGRQREHTLLAT